METLLLIVHVLLAAGIIALVLLQQGKGAEAGASFGGGGASQTVFGSQGSGNVVGRVTAVLAAGIFATSFILAIFAKDKAESINELGIPAAEVVEAAAQTPELPAIEAQRPVSGNSDIPTVNE